MDEINVEILADEEIDITPEIDNDFLKGDPGPKGDKGDKGDKGEQGIQGERGDKGEQGEPGYTPVKGVDYFTPEDIAEISYDDTEVRGLIQTNANNITLLDGVKADITDTGKTVTLSINSSTFVITLQLKNSSGTVLSTTTVDLPLEDMVIGGSYDNVNKAVVLTKKDGTQANFSIADIISGLQTEITSSNKLSSDLVDDTNNTNKFVTTSEKTTWNNKSDFSGNYNDLSNKPTIPPVKNEASTTAGDVYDVRYINTTIGNIESLLSEI